MLALGRLCLHVEQKILSRLEKMISVLYIAMEAPIRANPRTARAKPQGM